ncbi:MAG TPA: hypothetical protein VJI46_05170 [Candidatus Nanoarchaeia archaeon]|nr:hypothetical protein [Candidatus Nanoarchaeia archaeon]
MDTEELGGNIALSGFSDCDSGTMIILKKIIGNYAKDFSERLDDFEKLHLRLIRNERQFDVEAIVTRSGSSTSYNASESNIFVGVDGALKKAVRSF